MIEFVMLKTGNEDLQIYDVKNSLLGTLSKSNADEIKLLTFFYIVDIHVKTLNQQTTCEFMFSQFEIFRDISKVFST